jgi:hypothetical protein
LPQGHQFIDLGDDAVLLGEGREGDRNLVHSVFWQAAATCASLLTEDKCLEIGG